MVTGEPLIQRKDDSAAVLKSRVEAFHIQNHQNKCHWKPPIPNRKAKQDTSLQDLQMKGFLKMEQGNGSGEKDTKINLKSDLEIKNQVLESSRETNRAILVSDSSPEYLKLMGKFGKVGVRTMFLNFDLEIVIKPLISLRVPYEPQESEHQGYETMGNTDINRARTSAQSEANNYTQGFLGKNSDAFHKIKDAEVRSFIESCLAPVEKKECLQQSCRMALSSRKNDVPISISLVKNMSEDGHESISFMLWKGQFLLKGNVGVPSHVDLWLRFPDPSGNHIC
uniref:Uncharacterized protein n=1 Tax=Oryza brachyantha TaxID=4533 RepID=J3L091_ORYBR